MDEGDKIVIIRAFDTVILANLAKTKLDAYDIPCFLTEENFTGLYPLRNDIFPGVRLHVFERDRDEARRILDEQVSVSFIQCPHCQSRNWEKVMKPTKNRVYTLLLSLIALNPPVFDEEYVCKNCGRRFEP